MKRFTPILFASLLLLTIFAVDGYAQPAPTVFPTITLDEGVVKEYWDTLTGVTAPAVHTFPRELWYVTVGILDTTDVDTFLMYPNSGSSDWPIRLQMTHPNKFFIPMLWSFGPLKISNLTVWGDGTGDNEQMVWIHGYPVPTGH